LPAAKVSRIETARIGVKADDLDALLDLYGVDDVAKRALLHSLSREGSKRGWWQPYRDTITPAYADLISLEAEASSFSSYQTSLIPGLLQAPAYARATISALNVALSADQVSALVDVRTARQSVLTRPEPLELWAIVHEAALHPRLTAPGAMRDQLQHLLDRRDLPNVSIQVLPLNAEPHPGLQGPFTVIGFPESADLDVALLESLTAMLYVEDPGDVATYRNAFEHLRATALPLEASADLIKQVKDNL
ncbi:DUF5753 domain-containing protein, partial [Streptomyces sp. NPDC091376]|uniref:DUF5753 domain-containing protein n=1 Tax=Streptomyces sp. NPDC091376 TaxID=3365994 RepID=UPI003807DDAC